MQLNMKLGYIAKVTSGVTFRSRIDQFEDGNVTVIQMKDLGSDNIVHADSAICAYLDKVKESQTIRENDIIFRSRGQTNTAVFVNKNIENAVLAAPLLRVRIDESKILPEYLFWYLNQPEAQTYFATQARGSQVRMIGKSDLDNMQILLPSLEKQRIIADIVKLSIHEQEILKKIQTTKNQYTRALITKIIETGECNA